MNVVPVLILCSLFLVVCAVVLFIHSVRQGDHEHSERLSLLPLEDDPDVHVSDRDGDSLKEQDGGAVDEDRRARVARRISRQER